MPRCLMVSCGSILGNDGYSTRVWTMLRAVREVQGPDERPPVLLGIESIRTLKKRDQVAASRQRAERTGCELWLVPGLPKSLPGQFALNRLWAACIVRYVAWRTDARVIHAHGHTAATAVATAFTAGGRTRMVFDVHGVDVEERIADGRLHSAAARCQQLAAQAAAVARADDLIVVTSALGEYVRKAAHEAGQTCDGRVRLVPCILSLSELPDSAEPLRAAARARLGMGPEPCVLYLGSSSPWQQPQLVLDVFAALRTRVPTAKLLIITVDPARFAELATAGGLDPSSYIIESVPHHEVPRLAAAADVGLLLREDTIVNRVSSPTKFAEYLSLGIPVVVTEVLDDFARLVRSADVGAVVPSNADAAEAATAVADVLTADPLQASLRRQRCMVVVQEHLSFASILPTYAAIYGCADDPAVTRD